MKAVLEASKLGAVGYILKHSPKAEALRMLREAVDGLADEDDETAE
jgi:DNA-binding NarL/FixJ family response regulator